MEWNRRRTNKWCVKTWPSVNRSPQQQPCTSFVRQQTKNWACPMTTVIQVRGTYLSHAASTICGPQPIITATDQRSRRIMVQMSCWTHHHLLSVTVDKLGPLLQFTLSRHKASRSAISIRIWPYSAKRVSSQAESNLSIYLPN